MGTCLLGGERARAVHARRRGRVAGPRGRHAGRAWMVLLGVGVPFHHRRLRGGALRLPRRGLPDGGGRGGAPGGLPATGALGGHLRVRHGGGDGGRIRGRGAARLRGADGPVVLAAAPGSHCGRGNRSARGALHPAIPPRPAGRRGPGVAHRGGAGPLPSTRGSSSPTTPSPPPRPHGSRSSSCSGPSPAERSSSSRPSGCSSGYSRDDPRPRLQA